VHVGPLTPPAVELPVGRDTGLDRLVSGFPSLPSRTTVVMRPPRPFESVDRLGDLHRDLRKKPFQYRPVVQWEQRAGASLSVWVMSWRLDQPTKCTPAWRFPASKPSTKSARGCCGLPHKANDSGLELRGARFLEVRIAPETSFVLDHLCFKNRYRRAKSWETGHFQQVASDLRRVPLGLHPFIPSDDLGHAAPTPHRIC
jgi:hypothetical protein